MKTKFKVQVWYWNWNYKGKLDKKKLNKEKMLCEKIELSGERIFSFDNGFYSMNLSTEQIKKLIIERL